MTVSYNHVVANGGGFGNFWKTLFRWKGSIYKLILPDLTVYILIYYAINCMDRFWISTLEEDDIHRMRYHLVVDYCQSVASVIPLQFLLGFYISQIVIRWWDQYMCAPWPDTTAVITAITVHGHDERGRMMRRTLLRYVNLCVLFVFATVSPQARKRFPTMRHMVDAGFLMEHEMHIIEDMNEKLEGPKYYVPIVWAAALASKARKEERIRDDLALYNLIKTLCTVRLGAGDLLSYDWISFPLVYTQVVTLSVYIYFIAYVIGAQNYQEVDKLDLMVPIFNFLEFFFMVGWLKVAEILINPFGEDDDDFEVNWLIDRNIQISYLIVDEMNTMFPEMMKDDFWDDVIPTDLYYTKKSLKYKTGGYAGSAIVAEESSSKKEEKNDEEIKELDHDAVIVHRGGHHDDHHHDHHHDYKSDTELFEHNYAPLRFDSTEDLQAAFADGDKPS